MRSHCSAILERIVRREMFDLTSIIGAGHYQSSGTSSWPVPANTPHRPTIAGLMNFSGESMRGTLVIASSFNFFASTRPSSVRHPVAESSASDLVLVRDWAAECANQLLGRIMNRVCIFGVIMDAGASSALSGPSLDFYSPKAKDSQPLAFVNRQETVWVWLDAFVDPELDLTKPKEGARSSATEGDAILF